MTNNLSPQMVDKKGKMRAEDLDVAFAQAAALHQNESSRVEEVQDISNALANATIEDTTKQATPTPEDFKT